jgi:hypothetical protein
LFNSLDSRIEEEEKAIARLSELAAHLRVGMKFVTDVRHHALVLLDHEAALDHRLTHGFRHLIEDMGAHEVAPRQHSGAALVLRLEETLAQLPTKEGVLHQEDSHPEEMKE